MLRGLGNGALYCLVDFKTFAPEEDVTEVPEISDAAAATSSSVETVLSTFMKLLGRGFGASPSSSCVSHQPPFHRHAIKKKEEKQMRKKKLMEQIEIIQIGAVMVKG